MTLLTGMTEDGTEVPVQVKPDGRLVAEGLPGPAGGVGPAGPAGPQGPQGVKGDTGTTVLPPPLFVTSGSDGKVGIGTSSPNRLLEVSAGSDNFIRVDVSSGAYKSGIEFAHGSNVYSQLYFNNVAPYDLSLLQQYNTGSLILGTNNTERLRITSDGKVGIGTQSPTSVLDVNGDLRLRDCAVFADNAAAVAGGLGPGDVYRTATGQLMIAF